MFCRKLLDNNLMNNNSKDIIQCYSYTKCEGFFNLSNDIPTTPGYDNCTILSTISDFIDPSAEIVCNNKYQSRGKSHNNILLISFSFVSDKTKSCQVSHTEFLDMIYWHSHGKGAVHNVYIHINVSWPMKLKLLTIF